MRIGEVSPVLSQPSRDFSFSAIRTSSAGDAACILCINWPWPTLNAAKDAFGAGERILGEAEKLGGEAMHAAERGTTAAVTGVQKEIERNPLTAVLIALGFGVAIGFFLRK